MIRITVLLALLINASIAFTQPQPASRTLVLKWFAAQNAVIYQIQVSKSRTFRTLAVNYFTPDTCLGCRPGGRSIRLDRRTWYYWRVLSINSVGKSKWSEVWNFRTGAI